MRTKASLLTMLLYALLITIAFRAASSVTGVGADALFAPMLWTAIILACVMGVMASYEFERHDDAIMSSMLAPVERGHIFLGKLLSNLVIGLIAAAFTMLLGMVMFPLGAIGVLPLLAIMALGTAATISILCLVALISSVSSLPRVLLPLAAVPLLIFTVVLPAVDATARVMMGGEGWNGMGLEALVALAVTAAGFLLAGPLTEAA